jgi:hypothetical protein
MPKRPAGRRSDLVFRCLKMADLPAVDFRYIFRTREAIDRANALFQGYPDNRSI